MGIGEDGEGRWLIGEDDQKKKIDLLPWAQLLPPERAQNSPLDSNQHIARSKNMEQRRTYRAPTKTPELDPWSRICGF